MMTLSYAERELQHEHFQLSLTHGIIRLTIKQLSYSVGQNQNFKPQLISNRHEVSRLKANNSIFVQCRQRDNVS